MKNAFLIQVHIFAFAYIFEWKRPFTRISLLANIDSYALDLDIDFESAFLRGSVIINLEDYEQGTFELDAQDMDIKSVQVNGKDWPFEYSKENALIKLFNLPKDVTRGMVITVSFEKNIPDNAATGVYKCRYGSEYFIVTDFEPDRAKQLFPCKDDPLWKAVFNVNVTTRKDLTVISNTSIKTSQDLSDEKRKKVTFNPTPKMSTYLFFLGLGKFVESESFVSGTKKKIIVASRAEVADKCEFTHEIAASAIKDSESYFGVPYSLDKLHLIALTEYSGAMENWGAITESEVVTIIDPKTSSMFDRAWSALVTIHEIQHQWFGDLVTMKWWNDIWLNEGFATFMSHKILDRLHPEWNIWGFFMWRYQFETMKWDQLQTTHPVDVKLKTASEMNEVFDQISYGKGASILRMIEAYLGEESFRTGIRSYIMKFSYSNASSEDLWQSLETESKQPVSQIMKAWVRKIGFPLVSVERRGNKLSLHQEKFMLTRNVKKCSEEVWPIPIIMKINDQEKRFLLTQDSYEIDIPGGNLVRIKVNYGQSGFYCVKYDDAMYSLLEKEFSSMNALDRTGVVNDLFQLLLADSVEPRIYFRFVSLCANNQDYETVFALRQQLFLLLSIAEKSQQVQNSAKEFLNSQIERLSLSRRENENETDPILREVVSMLLGRFDDGFAQKLADRFSEYESLEPEIRAATAASYARCHPGKSFDDLMGLLKGSKTETDREKLYWGLTSLQDPTQVKKVLDFSASGEVPRSDIHWTLIYASANPLARQTAWNWIKDNFDRLWELIGSTLFITNMLDVTVPRCCVEDEEDAQSFFSGERLKMAEMSYRKQLELLHGHSELRKRLSAK
jgi:tricorn protease interacting factor F2/3